MSKKGAVLEPETATLTDLWSDDNPTGLLNLAGIDENAQPALLPKGIYDAICDEATFGNSSAGNPMVSFKFKIQNCEGELEEFNGRPLWFHCTLNADFGLKLLKRASVALNPEINFNEFRPSLVGEYFDGNRCRLQVGQQKRKDTGVWQNSVKDVLPAEGDSFWS